MSKKRSQPKQEDIVESIKKIAQDIWNSIQEMQAPEMSMPVRNLQNVDYDKEKGYFTLLDKEKIRTLTATTIKTFAQTLLMLSLSKNLVLSDDLSTKREVYYIAYNWGDAAFKDQPESDAVMEDVEAMLGQTREHLGFIAGEKAGVVAGDLVVVDIDSETKQPIEIDCRKFGTGSYSIPSIVEHFSFKTSAKFILAIEVVGAFERLNKHKYWKTANCIIIGMGGVPTRSTRRFIRKLADEHNIPVYVFTDGDPYGYGSIYRTLKVGSGNAAHVNEFFCVPQAKFIGVTPQDIIDYKLPTHKLKDVDVKKIKDLIKNDPFIKQHKEWQRALEHLAQMKVRVESQAFAAHSLNYVIDTYLPQKLADPSKWLP